jgi:hypothetical protein
MNRTVVSKHSIFIAKPREAVWDYTQDYGKRPIWDFSVLEASILANEPSRSVRLRARGRTTMTFLYKLDDRPNKTSLATTEVKSFILESGAGSWSYEEHKLGTMWHQTNSVVLTRKAALFKPILSWFFGRQTRTAMVKAKGLIEAAED